MPPRILEFVQRYNHKPDVEFFTRLPIEECKARLSHSMSSPWSISKKSAKGMVTDNRFYVYKKIHFRDSWNPTLRGELTSYPKGTYVRASFDSNALVTLFVVVIVGCIACRLIQMIASNPSAFLKLIELNAEVIPYIVLILIGAAIAVGYTIREGRRSKAYLINHIRSTLLATSIVTARDLMQTENPSANS